MLGSLREIGCFFIAGKAALGCREMNLWLFGLAICQVGHRWSVSKPKIIGIAKQTGFQTQQNCDFVTLPSNGSLASGKDLVSQLGRNAAHTCPLAHADPAFLELCADVSNSTNWYDLRHDGSKSFENGQECSEFRTS